MQIGVFLYFLVSKYILKEEVFITTSTTAFRITKKAGRIGAQVDDIQLGAHLTDADITALKDALHEHQVLFFRNQGHLDDAAHEAFATRFGDFFQHPTIPPKKESTAIFELDSAHGAKANIWHTDVTFVPNVPKYSILHGVKIPAVGGDTIWANTNTAYEELADGLREFAENTWALHSNDYDYAKRRDDVQDEESKQYCDIFVSTKYVSRHPVVHVHAETNKKHLLLGSFVRNFEGYTTEQSESLLTVLQAIITRPENTVRWSWQEGNIVIWDNLATQHYAIADYTEQRIVRRITVGDDVPVHANGTASTLIEKA